MRANLSKRLAITATAMGVVLTTPAFAQSASDTAASDIVVTARRVEERLQDVPISITVYTPEQLSNRNIVNSTDLATYTPSLTINGKYGPDKSSFAIRGFQQDLNTLPTVGVYFADVVAPRLTSNITSGNGAGVGTMWDLQNVQVLKGPQGTLFGRNTTGGAILIVPQKPTDQLGGYVEGTVGNHNAWRGQAVINLPLSDAIRIRAGVDRYKRDGWLNNRSGIGPKDFNDVNYWAARVSVVADITPDLENYAIFTYAKSETNGKVDRVAFCDPTATGTTAALLKQPMCDQIKREAGFGYWDVDNANPNPFVNSSQWQAINTTTWKASDTLTVKNIASYGVAKEAYSFVLNGDLFYPAFPAGITPGSVPPYTFVTTNPGPSTPQGHQWTLTDELQFQGQVGDGRLTWQVGGYFEHSGPKGGARGQEQWTTVFSSCTDVYAFKCASVQLPIPGGSVPIGSVGVARNVYSYHNYGLYGQATFKITDQFAVTAGIRNTWDWQREHADNVKVVTSAAGPLAYSCSRAGAPQLSPAPAGTAALLTSGACTRTFSTKSSEPTWLIDLEYKPNNDILAYVKYSRGYRGGGINEANIGAETWKPEFLDDYEVGLKTSFRGADVSGTFNVAGFWNEFRDQQASVFIPQCAISAANPACTRPAFTGINGIQNVGKSRLRGVEVDGTLLLLDNHLRFDLGYAYLDAKVTGGSVPSCDSASFLCNLASFLLPGAILPYAPKHRVTLAATYTLPINEDVGKVSIGGTFTHTSRQYSGHANDLAFSQGKIPFNASLNPATDLLTLNMNWTNVGGSPVDLALFMTNVTNEKYYVASGNSLATTGSESIVVGEPRMFGARVKIHFGN